MMNALNAISFCLVRGILTCRFPVPAHCVSRHKTVNLIPKDPPLCISRRITQQTIYEMVLALRLIWLMMDDYWQGWSLHLASRNINANVMLTNMAIERDGKGYKEVNIHIAPCQWFTVQMCVCSSWLRPWTAQRGTAGSVPWVTASLLLVGPH